MSLGGIYILKIKFNNDDAFYESLCTKYFERIYFYCKRLVKGQEQFMDFVEECTQNTFLEARKQISKLRNHPNVEGWLYTTARNLINSSYRSMYIKRKHEVSMDDAFSNCICEPEINLEELFSSAADLDKLSAEILQKLTPSEHDLYVDYFVNKASVSDLSRKYGISVTATTTRIYRLKKKIKNIVREYFMDN
ncbi:sigma-70 family RNA polymerase sigma factor [Pseudoclostridium thermosuccinogenes]|uniref:RNA polymerase sigma factor n=1 Tax=Clostridium thermosuccinogenes TaxID=84032 RepID=UPI002FD97367